MTSTTAWPFPTERISCVTAAVLLVLVGIAPASASESRTVEDHLGREVAIPMSPERVLALHRTFIEDLLELGVMPVGRVHEYRHREEAAALPSIGREGSPDLEAIYELTPDLILANARRHGDLLDALELSGAAVFYVDPGVLDEDPMLDRIELFGQLLGLEDVAEAYAARLNALSAELREQVARCGHRTAIIVQGGSESVLAAQQTGMYHALLTRLGLENIVPRDLPGAGRSTWVSFDIEAIMRADPDVFLVRAARSGETEQALVEHYRTAPEWQGLTAIREGKVFVLPAQVNPGSISNEDALRIAADLLCPLGAD